MKWFGFDDLARPLTPAPVPSERETAAATLSLLTEDVRLQMVWLSEAEIALKARGWPHQ